MCGYRLDTRVGIGVGIGIGTRVGVEIGVGPLKRPLGPFGSFWVLSRSSSYVHTTTAASPLG